MATATTNPTIHVIEIDCGDRTNPTPFRFIGPDGTPSKQFATLTEAQKMLIWVYDDGSGFVVHKTRLVDFAAEDARREDARR